MYLSCASTYINGMNTCRKRLFLGFKLSDMDESHIFHKINFNIDRFFFSFIKVYLYVDSKMLFAIRHASLKSVRFVQ